MNALRRLLGGNTSTTDGVDSTADNSSTISSLGMKSCAVTVDTTTNDLCDDGNNNEEEEFEQLIVTPSPKLQLQPQLQPLTQPQPRKTAKLTKRTKAMATKTTTELKLQQQQEEIDDQEEEEDYDEDYNEDYKEDYIGVTRNKKHKPQSRKPKKRLRQQRQRGEESEHYYDDGSSDDGENDIEQYDTREKMGYYHGYNHDKDDDEFNFTQRRLLALAIICATGLISMLCISTFKRHGPHRNGRYDWNTPSNHIPDELLSSSDDNSEGGTGTGTGVYSFSDFRNDIGVAVPYWKDLLAAYDLPYSDDGGYSGEYYDDDKFFNDEVYGFNKAKSKSTSKATPTLLQKKNATSGNSDVNVNDNDNEENGIIPHLGPCYLPHAIDEMNHIPWSTLIEKNYNTSHGERDITYPAPYIPYNQYTQQQQQHKKHGGRPLSSSSSPSLTTSSMSLQQSSDLAGYCRPGFIIIGAGKCGTSSLYHYLIGHDRVAPAKKKQIHYFKYYPKRPMSWYLSNFYGTEDFLSSGSLITGEASPGYLPYPDVAHRIQSYMVNKANNGKNQAIVPTPKIITIVRNPLERSYSSYNYNYVEPTLFNIKKDVEKARRKFRHRASNRDTSTTNAAHHHTKAQNKNSIMVDQILSKNMTDDEIIDEYLFSFEQLVVAEMEVLKKCLKKGGAGEQGAETLYGTKSWAAPLFEKRDKQQQLQEGSQGLPSLVTMDDSCYGGTVSSLVPRIQWIELVAKNPQKIINVKNLHLVQSIVGRSLYSLPLEWWYELYPSDDMYLVCNEDLKYKPSKTMSDVSDFLGLPTFDFEPVVSKGMYNVGGNDGYDKATDWKEAEGATGSTTPVNHKKNGDGIPISDELRSKYLSFVKPYNERLFEIAKKRCDW